LPVSGPQRIVRAADHGADAARLRLVIDGKAEVVEADDERVIRSERLTLPRPIVIRLTRFIHVPRRFRRQVTNTFLFRARPVSAASTAGAGCRSQAARRSHSRSLVPLSRGGTNDWSNVVTACASCNTRKANRLPERDRDAPDHAPVEPHFVHLAGRSAAHPHRPATSSCSTAQTRCTPRRARAPRRGQGWHSGGWRPVVGAGSRRRSRRVRGEAPAGRHRASTTWL